LKDELQPGQSIELLQALHIVTRDGGINQDSRRKLKQVLHLARFIEPLIKECLQRQVPLSIVDHGAGKAYLGFLLYDLYLKAQASALKAKGLPVQVWGIEQRPALVEQCTTLAAELGFEGMQFLKLDTAEAFSSTALPAKVEIVTALHACDTATDDALHFALTRRATHVVLVPCCQAEVARSLRQYKSVMIGQTPLAELWRHPIHTRELGASLTNVLRCLSLEAAGYSVTVTELVGWEHSLKNELIIATLRQSGGAKATTAADTEARVRKDVGQDAQSGPTDAYSANQTSPLPKPRRNKAAEAKLIQLLETFGLTELKNRFLPESLNHHD
jgi:hypothetical protein